MEEKHDLEYTFSKEIESIDASAITASALSNVV